MFNNVYIADIGQTPARVNRVTGDLYLNEKTWHNLTEEEQRFILLHELGHLTLQTKDEVKADSFAFLNFAEEGNSLRGGVSALINNLNFQNAEHLHRVKALTTLAALYDAGKNGENKSLQILNKNRMYPNILDKETRRNINKKTCKCGGTCESCANSDYSDLFGICLTRACANRKAEAKKQEEETKRAEADARARAAEAAAAQAAAQAAATASVSNVMLKQEDNEGKEEGNKLTLILGALAILSILVGLIFYLKNK